MEKYKVIIEIPKGNENNKYEYDEESKTFKLDFVFENIVWPFNYGFFPRTLAGDGDTLDAVVLSSATVEQGTEVECKIVGGADVLDRGEVDVKILCVPVYDKLLGSLNEIQDISEQQKQVWTKFFLELARQKNKTTEVRGFFGKDKAIEIIKKSLL